MRWTRLARSLRLAAVAAAVLAAAGCASPLYRANAGLAGSALAIQRVGLLPPLVSVYEEQVRFAMQELVPREAWTREAAQNLTRAFTDELGAAHQAPVAIAPDEPEVADFSDLFSAVDRSVTRHAYADSPEAFPERAASFDYSLGSAAGLMERQNVDAVWIVAGANLVPTAGAQVRDAVDVLMAIVAALGRAPAFTTVLAKLDLRSALVARDGTVLFFCRISAADVVSDGDTGASEADDGGDLRSPAFARRVVRTVLDEYRKATTR